MRISAVVVASLLFATSLAFAADSKKLEKHQLQVDRLGPIAVGMTAKEASAKSGIVLNHQIQEMRLATTSTQTESMVTSDS